MFHDIKRLQNPPEQLNIIGRLCKSDERALAVIGARRMSKYGQNVIRDFVPRLVAQGFTIISGLAVGCDSLAQKIALECGGRTIGVLGFGLNHLQSDYNYQLIKQVINSKRGVVLSPFHRNQKPTRETFIYRNSLMAAMGLGILVIEASARSGVFHTVNFGLDLGKDVWAVPGNIFSYNSLGTHKLIKEGAFLADDVADILTHY